MPSDFIENFPDFKAADKTIQDQKNDKQQKYHGVLPVDVQHNHQNGQETDRDDFRKICDCRDDPADYRLRQSSLCRIGTTIAAKVEPKTKVKSIMPKYLSFAKYLLIKNATTKEERRVSAKQKGRPEYIDMSGPFFPHPRLSLPERRQSQRHIRLKTSSSKSLKHIFHRQLP